MKGFQSLASILLCYFAFLFSFGHAAALAGSLRRRVEIPGTGNTAGPFNLAARWFQVKGGSADNIVSTGATRGFNLKLGESQSFITTSLFGCSVAVLMGPDGVVIGHMPQQSGTLTTIDDIDTTEKFIDAKLQKQLDDARIELEKQCEPEQTHGYILSGSSKASPGVALLKDFMVSEGVPLVNIVVEEYTGSGSGGADLPGPSQKFLVRWDSPNPAAGGTLEIYRFADVPVVRIRYDAEKHEIGVAHKRAQAGKVGKACQPRHKTGATSVKPTPTTAPRKDRSTKTSLTKKNKTLPATKATATIIKSKVTSTGNQSKTTSVKQIKPVASSVKNAKPTAAKKTKPVASPIKNAKPAPAKPVKPVASPAKNAKPTPAKKTRPVAPPVKRPKPVAKPSTQKSKGR